MFSKPRANVIESDGGFSVEVLGRTGLLYTEGSRSPHIDSEVSSSTEIAVFKKSIRAWGPPHSDETIDDNKRDTIIINIRRAFQSQGKGISVW